MEKDLAFEAKAMAATASVDVLGSLYLLFRTIPRQRKAVTLYARRNAHLSAPRLVPDDQEPPRFEPSPSHQDLDLVPFQAPGTRRFAPLSTRRLSEPSRGASLQHAELSPGSTGKRASAQRLYVSTSTAASHLTTSALEAEAE